MDPQSQFCPNEHCRARGLRGQGTIRIHSQKEGRYRCTTCGGTFSPTTTNRAEPESSGRNRE